MSRLFAKGNNFVGQLGVTGNIVKSDKWVKVNIPDGEKVKKAEANFAQSMVLTEEGNIYYWGWGFDSTSMTKVLTHYQRSPPIVSLIQVGSSISQRNSSFSAASSS